MNAQLRAHRARERFARAVGLLRVEIQLGTERRHIDNLVELCKAYLEPLDGTEEHRLLAAQLDEAVALVPRRRPPTPSAAHARRDTERFQRGVLRLITGGDE